MDQSQMKERLQKYGYVVVPEIFSPEEVAHYHKYFFNLRKSNNCLQYMPKVDPNDADQINEYPRLIQMHRWDSVTLKWLLDKRLRECLVALLGQEPYAVQSMLYYKPPGSRGQALHQDQYFLAVQPGTCIAAWMALDACDELNGCLQVVPGSHELPTLCTTVEADTTESFTDITISMPEGMHPTPVLMKAGEVLFFNGQLIHGSFSNTSNNRFRMSLIGHYVMAEAEKVAEFYHPVLRFDGSDAALNVSKTGGPCGNWVDVDGQPLVEMSGVNPSSSSDDTSFMDLVKQRQS